MEERANPSVAFSPIVIVAVFSIVALLGVSAWKATGSWRTAPISNVQENISVSASDYTAPKSAFDWQKALEGSSDEGADAAGDPDGLTNIGKNVVGALIGSYVALSDSELYTPEQGDVIAETIAEDLRADVSYHIYTSSEVTIDPVASHTRMMTYRNDMRVALEPLFEDTRYELEAFGHYIETKDPRYLDELKQQAAYYGAAKQNVLNVVVPADAVQRHIDVLNALSQFEAALVRMTEHASDPFASAALLRTFNDAEVRMFMTFSELAKYYQTYPQT